MRDQDEPDPAENIEAVEDQLTEPLLIDPRTATRPDEQRILIGDAVPDHVSTAEERQPAVLHELLSDREHPDKRDERDREQRQPMSLDSGEEPKAALTKRAGGDER